MRRFTILPLACYAALLGYGCYAWFLVGHWPYYAHPDPKELPHRVLLNIVSVVFLIGLLSLVVIPVAHLLWCAVAHWRKWPIPPQRRPYILFAAGVALWVLDFAAVFTDLPWTSNISWLLD